MLTNPTLIDAVVMTIISGIFTLLTIYVKSRLDNKKKTPENHIKLIYHPFFAKTEILKTDIVNTFTLANKGKELVFKEIITEELNIFKEMLTIFANEVDDNKITDSTHLYNRNSEILINIIKKHHSFYKNGTYTSDEILVFEKVMRKYEQWNQEKINRIQDNMLMTCQSPFYSDIYIKGAVILDLYLAVIIDTINDAASTLGSLNGDLHGLVFKGVMM